MVKNDNIQRIDILINIAKMYYLEDLSQEEISNKLHVSRSNISRMLKECREEKIIEFKIRDTSSTYIELQKKIKDFYGLKEVIVVPGDNNIEQAKSNVGKAAASYLESVLKNGMLLGIAWGTTICYLVQHFDCISDRIVDVIQLTGGTYTESLKMDGRELVKELAKKLNGNWYLLQTPMIVQSKVLRDLLMEEPEIKKHFELIDKTDVAIAGLGSSIPEHYVPFKAGYISKEETEQLVNLGAIGDICGNKLDINGNTSETILTGKVIAVDLEQLRKIPLVIGVAAGAEKAASIVAGLRGKYLKALVIDELAALNVLKLENI
jgi:deoxyribonucleoside regulator